MNPPVSLIDLLAFSAIRSAFSEPEPPPSPSLGEQSFLIPPPSPVGQNARDSARDLARYGRDLMCCQPRGSSLSAFSSSERDSPRRLDSSRRIMSAPLDEA